MHWTVAVYRKYDVDVAGNQTEEDGVLHRCGWEPNGRRRRLSSMWLGTKLKKTASFIDVAWVTVQTGLSANQKKTIFECMRSSLKQSCMCALGLQSHTQQLSSSQSPPYNNTSSINFVEQPFNREMIYEVSYSISRDIFPGLPLAERMNISQHTSTLNDFAAGLLP